MKLGELARVSEAVAATSSRTEKIGLLAECLRALAPDERETGVAWLAGVLPEGRLGLGPAAVHALRGVPPAAAPTLGVRDAREALARLREVSGKGSAARRQALLAELAGRATEVEQRFLARLLVGELRQGALEGVMSDAIAAAARVPAAAVRKAVMLAGALAPVASAALDRGVAGLAEFKLRLYDPVGPMLATPTEDVASALGALETAAFEYKLDGARAQVHKGPEGVRIYSRTGRDVTDSLPEIEGAVARLPAESLILDGEVLALERDGRPKAFQETMRRFGRKLEIDDARSEVPLSLFCFDCLHAQGEDLLDAPTETRCARLAELVPRELLVPRLVTSDRAAAEAFLGEALARGHEGLMAKSLSSPYEAGRRGASWLKIKVAHTLDLVVLAAEWGNGRRRGWLSNLHLGARDEQGGFVMLGKTFKGLTDETLAWQTEALKRLAIDPEAGGYVVPVRPELVVEVAFNELQASRRYPGGLALRFARVVRYRPDKTAADADSMDTVRAIAAGRGYHVRRDPSAS
ncbi:MAG TPA: ATP-dependent DNA ligase [Gammaproteobacteria bacterium]|nr:ATP-dependent DNA ligase [Gammaproteobacteria bacterium]